MRGTNEPIYFVCWPQAPAVASATLAILATLRAAVRPCGPSVRPPYRLDNMVDAGWSSPVARQAHNLKVTGSNPVPATKHHKRPPQSPLACGAFCFGATSLFQGNGMRSKSGNCRNASKRSQNRIALTIWPLASCPLRLGRGELPAEIIVSAMAD